MKIKIDLHLHSPLSKSDGDSIKWESNYDSLKKLKANKIKIASFTDHNVFDYIFYKSIKKIAQTGDILVLPGIEVNVKRKDDQIANLIYVFSDQLSEKKFEEIEQIAKTNIPKRGIMISESNEIFKNYDHIKIPHIWKSDHFKCDDLLDLQYDAFEITNFAHPNYKSVIKKFKSSVVAFSDTHIWTSYPQQKRLYTEIEMEEISFKCLKKKLKENKIYAKEVLSC